MLAAMAATVAAELGGIFTLVCDDWYSDLLKVGWSLFRLRGIELVYPCHSDSWEHDDALCMGTRAPAVLSRVLATVSKDRSNFQKARDSNRRKATHVARCRLERRPRLSFASQLERGSEQCEFLTERCLEFFLDTGERESHLVLGRCIPRQLLLNVIVFAV